MKKNDNTVIPIIPQYLVDDVISRRKEKEVDIEDIRYFEDDFEDGVIWAQKQMGNLAVEFAEWLYFAPQCEEYDRMKTSLKELYSRFIKFKQNR